MPRQDLMAALMGDYRFEREIVRILIALECFRLNRKHILLFRAPAAILRATGLAVDMPILDAAHKAQGWRDARDSLLA